MTLTPPESSSTRKMLRVLLAFDATRPVRTVADLAATVGLPLSTTYRYVSLLRDEGLLEAAPQSDGGYRLGPRVSALGRTAAASDTDLVTLARPHLVALRDGIDETVVLARRAGDAVVSIDRVESRHPVRLAVDLGQSLPAHIGSSSRVLLAAAPESWRDAYLERVRPALSVTAAALVGDEALARTRESGWTQASEEVEEGIWSCAAAVTDGVAVVAAIGTAGPLYRLDEAQRRAVVAALRQSADAISRALRTP